MRDHSPRRRFSIAEESALSGGFSIFYGLNVGVERSNPTGRSAAFDAAGFRSFRRRDAVLSWPDPKPVDAHEH